MVWIRWLSVVFSELGSKKVAMMARQRLIRQMRSRLTMLLLGGGMSLLAPAVVQGQIVPDETLAGERSQVSTEEAIRNLPSQRIFGGAVRDRNLFHSFEEFSIDPAKGAYFTHPIGIDSIFSRVTGNAPSNILGRLGVLGTADLYFMNPNGIVFGPASSLDIQGSFAGTTADGIQFDDEGIFSALDPELPSQLLTVNPSAYLFTQLETPSIQSTSQNLTVSPNQSFTLLGGDILFQNSFIQALSGGEIELGSAAGVGRVHLDSSSGSPRLSFSQEISRGNIGFNTGAGISMFGEGRIGIHAQELNVSNGSGIFSFLSFSPTFGGISTPNSGGRTGADIVIDTVGDVTIADLSFISSGIFGGDSLPERKDSGDVEIHSNSVYVTNGSVIASLSVGQGDAGNIVIEALNSITLSGRSSTGNASGIGSPTASFSGLSGVGSGGNVILRAPQITLRDEARISSISNVGAENAGSLRIFASDTLIMSSGASFNTETFGQGDAGFIEVHADNLISLDGVGTNGNITGFFSSVNPAETSRESRQGGNITVTTLPSGSFNMTNGARISGNVEAGAVGEAGAIDIRVGNMSLTNGSQIQSFLRDADTLNNLAGAQGRAGGLNIDVNGTLTATGRDSNGFQSGFFTNAGAATVGNAGNIKVSAETISFNNSIISSTTQSSGNAGFLDIQAQDIRLNDDTLITSATFGIGEGGGIKIAADQLVAQGGGQISAGSGRENVPGDFGRSGDIDVNITGLLELDGSGIANRSGIFAETSSFSRAGDLSVDTGRLIVRNGAAISASAAGSGSLGGDSGILTIHASESVDVIGEGGRSSALVTEANGVGNAGNLLLTTGRLTVRDGGVITSATRGQGNAGDVEINASDINVGGLSTSGNPGRILAAVEADANGEGGTIRIRTQNLTIEEGGRVSAASLTENTAGDIIIDATRRITLRNGEIVTTATRSSGGDILINTRPNSNSGVLFLERDGDITTESLEDGGNITLLLPVVAFDDSDIIARSQGANGGNIILSALFSDVIPPDNQEPFDGDGIVDVNADGEVSEGDIVIPDTSFIQDSLTELSESLVNTDQIVANRCTAQIAQGGTFTVTNADGLPEAPQSAGSIYSTNTVLSVSRASSVERRSTEQVSEPLTEPQGIYKLSDGRLLLGRDCTE
ncbi:MAG: filamentous hemagglutinin N-terminal domain-containing protein [Phormidesmis sp.]